MTQSLMDLDMFRNSHSTRGARLETPSVGRNPNGVPTCSLIGRKLGSIFEVPRDQLDTIDDLLREIDRKLCR